MMGVKVLSHAEAQKDSADEGEQSPAVQGSLNSNSNSCLAPEVRKPRLSPIDNSVSRTKTATFSQQGDTEEVINSLLKAPLDDGTINSSLKTIKAGKGVVNSTEHMIDHALPNKEGCLGTPDVEKGRSERVEPPPGFEDKGGWLLTPTVEEERSEGDGPPPGSDKFETQVIVKKNPRRKQLCSERRLTRSQKKLDQSSSQGTTESMRKLAEDSLEIGRILGVKVITFKGNAKRQFTDSTKEDKRKRSNDDQRQ